jgi:hypothetical protein
MLPRSFSSGFATTLPCQASMATDQRIVSFDARSQEYLTRSEGVHGYGNGFKFINLT